MAEELLNPKTLHTITVGGVRVRVMCWKTPTKYASASWQLNASRTEAKARQLGWDVCRLLRDRGTCPRGGAAGSAHGRTTPLHHLWSPGRRTQSMTWTTPFDAGMSARYSGELLASYRRPASRAKQSQSYDTRMRASKYVSSSSVGGGNCTPARSMAALVPCALLFTALQ